MSDRDAKAIAHAYAKWRLPLLQYLKRKLRNEADAEDLTQESFLRWSSAKGGTASKQPQYFLFHIAFNLIKDKLRRQKVRDMVMLSMDGSRHDATDSADALSRAAIDGMSAYSPMEQAASRQALRRLQEALDELPDRQREVFILSRVEGLTQAEIAQRLGISRQMVVRHLAKAVAYCELRTEYALFDREP